MSIFRPLIEKKLSSLFGSAVTFERMKISILTGSLEAEGMAVAGDAPHLPQLTVRRILAEVSVARALSGQLEVKSLRIEGARARADISAAPQSASPATPAANPIQSPAPQAAPLSPLPSSSSPPPQASSPIRLKVQSLQLTDAGLTLIDSTHGASYQLEVAGIAGQLKTESGRTEFTMDIGSVSRDGAASPLETLKIAGSAATGDITLLGRSPIELAITSGQPSSESVSSPARQLHARINSPDLSRLEGSVEFFGVLDITEMLKLVPPRLTLPEILTGARVTGSMDLALRIKISAGTIAVHEIIVRGVEIKI